jgi:anti-sigma regulatory factor (Ser/Thr protein kinase)
MKATCHAPGQARKAIKDYAELLDLPAALVDDVLLCVSEAVSNVVFHAYLHGEADGPVDIEASVDQDLRIIVRDRGDGFTVRHDSPGSGLGLAIITKLTRTFHIRTTSDGFGTEVIMRFELDPKS